MRSSSKFGNIFKKLKEYGGSSNAYTDDTYTVYYFDILSNNLDEVIDIFSRFFIDPLFNINAVSREINAVNSEHFKNYNNDYKLKSNWSIETSFIEGSKKDFLNGKQVKLKYLPSDVKKYEKATSKAMIYILGNQGWDVEKS